MRPIIDAHLDLAWNALYFNRDLLSSIAEIRQAEQEMKDKPCRGYNTVSLPELRKANVPLCVGTLMARSGPNQIERGVRRTDLDYTTPLIAYAHTMGQLAYYKMLEKLGHLQFITTRAGLGAHWDAWKIDANATPLGVILSMEGTDAMLNPEQAEAWHEAGLRVAGPVHYGCGQYAFGTGSNGPLSDSGVKLLKKFAKLGIILDATHLSDTSFFQAMDVYSGPVLASHQNCRALVPGERQFSDEQIRLLLQRNAVIGTALDAWMLYPGWKIGETKPEDVGLTLEAVADHIDHICQLAGTARHCAIGSDLDGGYGAEQTPRDLDTVADLHKLEEILKRRGYDSGDIDAIFFGNWLSFFRETLP